MIYAGIRWFELHLGTVVEMVLKQGDENCDFNLIILRGANKIARQSHVEITNTKKHLVVNDK